MREQDQVFLPVMNSYEATVLVGYLAHAFNGDVAEVPPRASPLWPIAVRVVQAMNADRYHLGAYRASTIYDDPPVKRAATQRSVSQRSTPPRRPLNTVVRRTPGVMHSAIAD